MDSLTSLTYRARSDGMDSLTSLTYRARSDGMDSLTSLTNCVLFSPVRAGEEERLLGADALHDRLLVERYDSLSWAER